MPITKAEAQDATRSFVRDYPGALELAYKFREDAAELYGPRASEVPADMKGGYLPKETMHAGRAYRGRVDVPLQNIKGADDLLLTLRHEVLGHYGVNTFTQAEKRALLDGLAIARNEPTLKPLWDDVNRRYAGLSLAVRAEEVFALHCQGVMPNQHQIADQVQQRGQQSFTETCIARVRPMQAEDLHNIACMVAQGLRDCSRVQQNFPHFNELFRREENMEQKKPFHEVVAEKLIEQLKDGTAPWQKPWESGEPNAYLPMNPTTGRRYKGINAIHLMAQGRSDARWMTYRQSAALGAQVRKGEKGTPVQYWKFSEEQDKLDDKGRPILDPKGDPVRETVMLERPRVFFATVFNGEQIDGLPSLQPKQEQTWDAIERAEQILKASGARITHASGDRAFYRPSTDSITMPERGQFPSADRYYATALHELGHWTGHASRLARDLVHPFGSEGYAKEELRAEIASMIVGDELGIGHDPGQHAAYVGSWIKALQDDPLEVFRAAADAEKIHHYVLAFEQKQVQDQDQIREQPPHELTREQFANQATVLELTRHGRKWEVRHGNFSAFSDAESARDAISDVHHAAVNNALFLNTPDARSANLPAISFPPAAVLAEYSDLVQKFPDAVPAPDLGQQPAGQVVPDALRDASQAISIQEATMQTLQPIQAEAQLKAEAWTLKHVEQDTLGRLLEKASLEQIDRALSMLDSMQPMSPQNEFWMRHELPHDSEPLKSRIHAAQDELVEKIRPDAVVATILRDLKTRSSYVSEQDQQAFDSAAVKALGFALPLEWTGEVRVVGVVERDGLIQAADLDTETPEAYQLQARMRDAQPGADAFVDLTMTRTLGEVHELADRLALIDANSQADEYEKATRVGRVLEDRVRRDPNSTDEKILAAKEARKALEANAFVAAEAARNSQLISGQKEQQLASSQRQYLSVPFKEKDEVKHLGAKWDRQQQSWYVPRGVDATPFSKWAQEGAAAVAMVPGKTQQSQQLQAVRLYLAVPYQQRNEAKAAGALWDKAAKSWYAGPSADMAKLERWNPENLQAQQGPAMTPREEFAQAMLSAGLFVGTNAQGDHPVMDGKRHRVPVEGGKKGAMDGFYVGHLDGHPAGRIINNKTGADITWKSLGYTLSDPERTRLQAEAAGKLAQRAAEHVRAQEATAQRVGRQMADLVPIEQLTPYLQAKGIQAQAGVMTDREGLKTYIPAFDADGKLWTMQFIQEDGTKRFAKDSKKEGCFHPVGGMDALAAAPALVISEGYATAAQVAEAVGHATVAAFDSGNLESVARALHARFPDKPVIIAGDDDRHLVMTHGHNPGREKAEAAAQAVGGKAIFPIFASSQNSYLRELPVITPESYRIHLRAEQRLADAAAGQVELAGDEAARLKASMLSDAQMAALSTMKQHTDFNDLAQKSELGQEGMKRQLGAAIRQVKREALHQDQKVEKNHQSLEQRPRRAVRIG
jgi:antirestriction protein ArdC/phage/plasmid primase-like uncharacterized protein